MKNIIYTLFFICSVFTASSQVTLTLDEYNGLMTKIDSLENGWKQAERNHITETKDRVDSLQKNWNKIRSNYESQNTELNNQVELLKNENQGLQETNII